MNSEADTVIGRFLLILISFIIFPEKIKNKNLISQKTTQGLPSTVGRQPF